MEGVIKNNQKTRSKSLAQLDGYKRPLVGSLSANLQRFGIDKIPGVKSLKRSSMRWVRTMGLVKFPIQSNHSLKAEDDG